MKIFFLEILAIAASKINNAKIAKKEFPKNIACGMMRGAHGSVNDTISIRDKESCIFRVKPTKMNKDEGMKFNSVAHKAKYNVGAFWELNLNDQIAFEIIFENIIY
jgi:hypothetical protein